MLELNKESFEFNGFRLEIGERQLLHGGTSVSLTPKAFDVLAVLVRRSGRLVEKDELLRLVWDDAFVEESNIARIVHTLRRVLGENNDAKFIETVAKRGYRFVAEVKEAGEFEPKTVADAASGVRKNGAANGLLELSGSLSSMEPPKEQSKAVASREPIPWSKIALAAFLLIATIVAVEFFLAEQGPFANTTAGSKSLAILPLKPIDEENHDPIYELGIAETLILKLSTGNGLTVRPLSATRIYRQPDQSPTAAGQEQRVDFVLSSNYQLADGKVRVTSQLIDVRSGAVAGVFKSEHDSANVFQMQDQIASDIGNTLLAQFGARPNDPKAKRGTENEEAYRLFLQAEYIFGQVDKEDIGKAIGYLETAVKLDPSYAKAYATLAYAYRHMAKGIVPPEEQYRRSKAAADRALELDPGLAEAHAVLAMIKATAEADLAGAETEYKQAVELDPGSPSVRSMYAFFLASVGRFDDGLAQIKVAQELEPASLSHDVTYGQILYYAHRFPEATAHFRRVQENHRDLAYSYFWLFLLHDLQGNDSQAYDWFVKYETQIKTTPETMKIYQAAYERSGWKGVLREHILQDEKDLTAETESGLYYEMACFSARLGNKDKALEYLDKAYRDRGFVITLTKVDPYFDSLQGDPRFNELLKRIGLT